MKCSSFTKELPFVVVVALVSIFLFLPPLYASPRPRSTALLGGATDTQGYCGYVDGTWYWGTLSSDGRFTPLSQKVKSLRVQICQAKGIARKRLKNNLRELSKVEKSTSSACVSGTSVAPGASTSGIGSTPYLPSPTQPTPVLQSPYYPGSPTYPVQSDSQQDTAGDNFLYQSGYLTVQLTQAYQDGYAGKTYVWFDVINRSLPQDVSIMRTLSTIIDDAGRRQRATGVILADGEINGQRSVGIILPSNRHFALGLVFDAILSQGSTSFVELNILVPRQRAGDIVFYNVPLSYSIQ